MTEKEGRPNKASQGVLVAGANHGFTLALTEGLRHLVASGLGDTREDRLGSVSEEEAGCEA